MPTLQTVVPFGNLPVGSAVLRGADGRPSGRSMLSSPGLYFACVSDQDRIILRNICQFTFQHLGIVDANDTFLPA